MLKLQTTQKTTEGTVTIEGQTFQFKVIYAPWKNRGFRWSVKVSVYTETEWKPLVCRENLMTEEDAIDNGEDGVMTYLTYQKKQKNES